MASEIHYFKAVVPAGTPIASPIRYPFTMPPRSVQEIDIRVPPGPRGEVGFALGASGLTVLPFEPGTWIVADDDRIVWPLEGQIDSGAWELQAYNTGSFPHTLYVTFKTVITASPQSRALTLVPVPATALDQLSGQPPPPFGGHHRPPHHRPRQAAAESA